MLSENPIRWIVHSLLSRYESFTNADIARRTGSSRQCVLKHLQRLVDEGEIVRFGEGRGTRYRAPREWETLPRMNPHEVDFWRDLARQYPKIAYLHLASRGKLRTKRDADRIATDVTLRTWAILDFRDVAYVPIAFAEQLLRNVDLAVATPLPINTSPDVARALRVAFERRRLRPARWREELEAAP